MATTSTTTRYPVVLVHGLFGYGHERPLWNMWMPYWPERALKEMNVNVLFVDVGAVSSDHDRACELFYQLFGGTVDYGEGHVRQTLHARYGSTYDKPMHPSWSAEHPIHLVGHSMGATTAIELYQLLCMDAFGVGSDHRWVRSITCIAGPLTGSTISHMCGLHGDDLVPWTPAHILTGTLGIFFKLYQLVPFLKGLFDLRMDQWRDFALRDVLFVDGRVYKSLDLAIYTCQPARRIARNSQLKHMDKVFLMSITTSPRDFYMPKREVALVALIVLLGGWGHKLIPGRLKRLRGVLVAVLALVLWRRSKKWNLAKMPSMFPLTWLMRHRAKSLHAIYEGFDPDHWQHNDGAVNIHSMLRPWFPKPQELAAPRNATNLADAASHTSTSGGSLARGLRGSSSTASIRSSSSTSSLAAASMARCPSHISIDGFHHEIVDVRTDDEEDSHSAKRDRKPRFEKGRWYVYRVDSNHLAGTSWDGDAADLYRSLFTMIVDEYEQEYEALPRQHQGNEALPKPLALSVRHGAAHVA